MFTSGEICCRLELFVQWFRRSALSQMLTDHLKEEHIGLSLNHLLRCETGRSISVTHSGQQQNSQHAKETSPKTQTNASHRLLMVIGCTPHFYHKEHLLAEFTGADLNIGVNCYKDTFIKLHRAFRNQGLGMLLSGVILLHDNALSHVVTIVRDALVN